jgi:hypothetical protein
MNSTSFDLQPEEKTKLKGRRMKKTKSLWRYFPHILAILLIVIGGNVRADLTSLTLQPTPDIASFFIDVAYNASSHTLAASGMTTCISIGNPEDPNNPITFDEDSLLNGTFSLSATVDNAGVASSGSLTMGGEVLGYGEAGPLLTANNLSFFNSFFTDTQNPNGDVAIFEFLFDVSGGEMADIFGGSGAKVGVILSWVSTAGDVAQNQFTADFDNLQGHTFGEGWGTAMADTAPIPEPVTVLLLGLGALIIRRK